MQVLAKLSLSRVMNRTALCWKSSARLWGSSRFPLLMIQHRDFSKEMPAIRLHPYNRLKDIAKLLKVPFAKIEKKLVVKRRKQYFCKFDGAWFSFPSTNAIIVPFGTARLLATKHGRAAELKPLMERGAGKRADRLPVVAVLGHFNHGKTTLLDNLAGTNFVSIEKHGITQIIRTRTVGIDSVPVTIVDTPGQDIFYRMRNYGASVADLVVLVVALDDGICPQTEECIGVAESIGCPVLVCINKIDMPSLADGLQGRVAKLQSQLREYDILENAMIVPISALTGAGVSVFKQSIVSMANALPAEGGEHAAYSSSTPMATRHGTVINSWVSQRDGVQLHVVIREGEIKTKDWFSSGGWAGYIGSIEIDDEILVERAGPGQAVKLRVHVKHQYDPLPLAETIFFVDKDDAWLQAEQRAMEYSLAAYGVSPEDASFFRLQDYAKHTLQYEVENGPVTKTKAVFDAVFVDDDGKNDSTEAENSQEEVTTVEGVEDLDEVEDDPRRKVVIKADSSVSLGTMYDCLTHLDLSAEAETGMTKESLITSPEYVNSRRVVRGGVGVVSTADVMVAVAAEAPILIYGVAIEAHAARLAESQKVPIFLFDKMQDVIDILLGRCDVPSKAVTAKKSKKS